MPELLSPAGNFECLKAAVYNGANEVYLGINNFNARNNIDGFSMENLENAVDFAPFFDIICLYHRSQPQFIEYGGKNNGKYKSRNINRRCVV